MQLVRPDNPMLRKVCRPDFSLSVNDISKMYFLMREAEGLGLAAPQVGIDARLFVTHWDEVFVNPRIVEVRAPLRAGREGCLSLPNQTVTINRWAWIRLADGQVFEGQKAAVIQHEIDHLNGILICDPIHRESQAHDPDRALGAAEDRFAENAKVAP